MRLIYLGTPPFAVPALKRLAAAGYEIVAVMTQPDRPVGRKQILTAPPVKLTAHEHGIRVLQPEKIRTDEARSSLEPLFQSVDAAVVAAYGRILPGWMLTGPAHGCINIHSSLLPKYRGAAPINWAIANGEAETGVTIMQMDEGLDTGPILCQRSLVIGPTETSEELTLRLSEVGAELLLTSLPLIARGELEPVAQDDSAATLAPILRREDGRVDWSMTALRVFNRRRGFTPFPGCFTLLGGERLEITACQPLNEPSASDLPPGSIILVERDSFNVQCGAGTELRVTSVQPAGKREMSVRDFLNGVRLKPGDRFNP